MPIIATVLPDDCLSADMTALFPEVAAILADMERPAKLEGVTFDSLRTAGVSRVQLALAPRALLLATDRVLNHIPLAQERATFLSGLGNGSLCARPAAEWPGPSGLRG